MRVGPHPRVMSALPWLSRLSRVSTIAQAEHLLVDALKPFGISYYAAWIAADPEHADRRTTIITNWPDDWTDSYIRESKYLYDPVVIHATSTVGGFFWHELPSASSTRVLELKRDAQRLGMIDGFTFSWRSSLPTATIMSLAGRFLNWKVLERQAVSAIADSFMLRVMFLRDQADSRSNCGLSAQERRILHLAAAGRSDKTISHELQIHRSTVLSYWARIRSKLGASDRAQAVAIGIRSGEIGL
jgi:DNA-binding CsgD family transcriptional regulator